MIGDSCSDMQFGRNLGMRTILVDSVASHRKSGFENAAQLAQFRALSLAAAVEQLLKR
jgi:phosphoglycolate phosphatase-like HAD superfamily hydrolase